MELLLDAIPIERVSVLLGHSSVKITERHYAPWLQARQAQLEADLVRAWLNDPIAQAEMFRGDTAIKGTSVVRSDISATRKWEGPELTGSTEFILVSRAGFEPVNGIDNISSRMLKKAINRLLTRAAQNRDCVFACVYRAATVREPVPKSLFHQPARHGTSDHQNVSEGHTVTRGQFDFAMACAL